MGNQSWMNLQPTISEIANAFKIAKESQDSDDLIQLRYLRGRRYTWFGHEELMLVYEIDKYISEMAKWK